MGNMLHRLVGDCFVLVHGREDPSDLEWEAYLRKVAAFKGCFDTMCTIVVTDGGAPGTAQRQRLNALLNGGVTPTAVLSSSIMVRGIVTALNWFNPSIKCYKPAKLESAFQSLGIMPAQRSAITAAIAEMQGKLRVPLAG